MTNSIGSARTVHQWHMRGEDNVICFLVIGCLFDQLAWVVRLIHAHSTGIIIYIIVAKHPNQWRMSTLGVSNNGSSIDFTLTTAISEGCMLLPCVQCKGRLALPIGTSSMLWQFTSMWQFYSTAHSRYDAACALNECTLPDCKLQHTI